uniref:Prolyl 4-hydroxylase alpha subunit domain-containing protein n=2 Tax=Ditylum brightwellii TaxID=49249 RepID=A0A7S4RBZ3_9STRA
MGVAKTLSLSAAFYFLGIYISPYVISANFFDSRIGGTEGRIDTDYKYDEINPKEVKEGPDENPFEGITLLVHRNGEVDPCGAQKADPLAAIRSSMDHIDAPSSEFDKYDFDSVMTRALASSILSSDSCGPARGSAKNGIPELLNFCDMGEDHTPVLLDHENLVPLVDSHGDYYFPCHFHTREGVRIASIGELADLARKKKEGTCSPEQMSDSGTCASSSNELHIYAVPAGRLFIFAPKYVGEIFDLPHVKVSSGLPVSLKVISITPRVFDVINFFDRDESSRIVEKALKETSETHRMKRSSTGASGYNVNSQRTSENGFDTHGKEAQKVKRRCLDVLGFDHYEESMTDGLQVLRYNKTTAYIPHMDWIDDHYKREEHNFDSAGVGSNRFATILLYMSDLDENDGGETVFKEGWPVGQPVEERVQIDEVRN